MKLLKNQNNTIRNSLLIFGHKYRREIPGVWKPEPLHKLICNLIQDAIINHKKIIITIPPQHGKSAIASVIAPIWYLLRNPDKNTAIISYSEKLAADKAMKARNLARVSIDKGLSKESKSKTDWALTDAKDISMRARGVGGAVTGNTFDYLVLDDLIKNHKEAMSKTHRDNVWNYIETSIETRLSDPAIVIAILTRWHLDDYANRLHKRWGWPIYNIPAICDDPKNDLLGRELGEVAAPRRKSKKFIYEKKRNMSDYNFSCLYQGRPTSDEFARIKREWFQYYDMNKIEKISTVYNVYQTIDTAATDKQTSDYFVCLSFAIVTKDSDGQMMTSHQDYDRALKENRELFRHIYIIDIYKRKIETTDHMEVLRLQREKWRPVKQYVENKTFGLNIIQAAIKLGLPIYELKADMSKFLRSEQISVFYKNNQVWHPKDAEWLEDFEDEIANFPVAPHDDQFDCVSYAGIVAAEKKI